MHPYPPAPSPRARRTARLYGFSLTLLLAALGASAAVAQTARVQVIHNAPDPDAAVVDVYVDGALALDDFAFRTASPFLDLPAGSPLEVGVAPANSTGAADALVTVPLSLENERVYSVVATGLLDPKSFAANPAGVDTEFRLLVNPNAREASAHPDEFQFFFVHGAPDAPPVRLRTGEGRLLVAEPRAYGTLTGHAALALTPHTLDLILDGTGTTVSSATLDATDRAGQVATLLASGFLDPAANRNGPPLTLLAVFPDGTTVDLVNGEPPPTGPTARVQFIHANAGFVDGIAGFTNLDTVDLYLIEADSSGAGKTRKPKDEDAIDNIRFRSFARFARVSARSNLLVGIAPSTSNLTGQGVEDTVAALPITFEEDRTYGVVLTGVADTELYAPNPDGNDTGLGFIINDEARETATQADSAEVAFVNSVTDAPTVNVFAYTDTGEKRAAADTLVVAKGVSYGVFSEYAMLPPDANTLELRRSSDNALVARYTINLPPAVSTGTPLVFLAAGFLDPAANQGGPAFDVTTVTPDPDDDVNDQIVTGGEVYPLTPENPVDAETADDLPRRFTLRGNYPNPFNPETRIVLDLPEQARVGLEVYDVTGRVVLVLPDRLMTAGSARAVPVDASTLPSGLYVYRVRAETPAGTQYAVGRMVVVK